MRDLITKIELAMFETALNPADPMGDYEAKKKALHDLEMDPASNDPEIKKAITQRRVDLEKEAEQKGVKEGGWDSSDIKDTQPDGNMAVNKELAGKLKPKAEINSPEHRQKMIADLTARAKAGDRGAAASLAALQRSKV